MLVLLDTAAAGSRGTFPGLARAAHEKDWTLVHFHPSVDLKSLVTEWPPDAAVLGPAAPGFWPALLPNCVSMAVHVERSEFTDRSLLSVAFRREVGVERHLTDQDGCPSVDPSLGRLS